MCMKMQQYALWLPGSIEKYLGDMRLGGHASMRVEVNEHDGQCRMC